MKETNGMLFEENEIKANHYVGSAVLILLIVVVVSWILNLVDVFDAESKSFTILTLVIVPELLIPYLLNRRFKGERKWLKFLLLAATITGVVAMDSLLTYSVTLLGIFPILLSCHYYSKKITIGTAVTMILCLGASTVFGTYFGILDLNNVVLAPGTVLSVVTNFEEAVLNAPIDYIGTVENALQYIYLPKLIILAALTPVCYSISTRTRALIASNQEIVRNEERIQAELDVAANIQEAMLPKILPTFPNRPEFDLYASMNAAKEVGGDFYDCFFTDDSHFAVVMADVSGKGIPASMFMVVSKTLLKNKLQSGVPIDQAFIEVNNQICDGNDMNMFVTMWATMIDLDTGKCEYVNAGHNPPLLKKSEGSFEYMKGICGLVVGAMEGIRYKKKEFFLEKGDILYLYTDGVTESIDETNEQYGEDRLQKVLDANSEKPVEDIIHIIREDIDIHAGAAEQFDDITMLVLRWKGIKEAKHERIKSGSDR